MQRWFYGEDAPETQNELVAFTGTVVGTAAGIIVSGGTSKYVQILDRLLSIVDNINDTISVAQAIIDRDVNAILSIGGQRIFGDWVLRRVSNNINSDGDVDLPGGSGIDTPGSGTNSGNNQSGNSNTNQPRIDDFSGSGFVNELNILRQSDPNNPFLQRIEALRFNAEQNDPDSWVEALGGARIEASLGRTITRPTQSQAGYDFIDVPGRGLIELKGPYVRFNSVAQTYEIVPELVLEEVAASINRGVAKVNNGGIDLVVVDTIGLTEQQTLDLIPLIEDTSRVRFLRSN